jgi:hypothetical protein
MIRKKRRSIWLTALGVLAFASAAHAAGGAQIDKNPAASFQYKRADLGSGYATVNILKTPGKSPYAITCNCDDHSLQDMTCPTAAYACTCLPHAYLICQ